MPPKKSLRIALAFSLLCILWPLSVTASPKKATQWGNLSYFNLSQGETIAFQDHSLRLLSVDGNSCSLQVDESTVQLSMARISLPVSVNGLQLFLAATRPVSEITTDRAFPLTYANLQGDVSIAVCDAGKPLLDPSRYVFPIDRSDGYNWNMDENSQMFAYLTANRAHEGIDFDLTGAQGTFKSKLLSIEDATVVWVSPGAPYEACVLLESASQKGIFYIYQHLDRERVLVSEGQKIKKGDPIGHIWGDNRWTHLHFTVIAPPEAPDYQSRYQYVLNAFPSLYELWNGSLEIDEPLFANGDFRFAASYWKSGNRQHLSEYSNVIGYGWRMGSWNPSSKIERINADQQRDVFSREGSALLRKIMYPDTPAAATNPNDWFDFEVRVPNGSYKVRARCGHAYFDTEQDIEIEGEAFGSFELSANEFANTPEKTVVVRDGYLTTRIRLKDDSTPAGLAFLSFHRQQ